MTYQIPPKELIQKWLDNDHFPMVTGTRDLLSITRDRLNSIIDQAVRWSANQELEACCKWLEGEGRIDYASMLHLDRRYTTQSLKEKALSEVAAAVAGGNITPERGATIRLALEQLND